MVSQHAKAIHSVEITSYSCRNYNDDISDNDVDDDDDDDASIAVSSSIVLVACAPERCSQNSASKC